MRLSYELTSEMFMKFYLESILRRYLQLLKESVHRKRYAVYGVTVDLVTNSNIILHEIYKDYSYFNIPPSLTQPNISLYAFSVSKKEETIMKIPERAILISRSPGFDLYKCESLYFMKARESDTIGAINQNGNLFVGVDFDLPIFYEMLRNTFEACIFKKLENKRIHSLHASVVARDKNFGIVFPASMFGGKTTTFLCCLKAGLKYLADDVCLIQRNDSKMRVLAFPTRPGVDRNFIRCFPELQFLLERKPFAYSTGVRKWFFHIEEVFPNSMIDMCEPHTLIFPCLWWSDESKIEKMKKSEAMQELYRILREPSFLRFGVFNRRTREEKFKLGVSLVDSMNCYKLYLGRKPENLIEILTDFLSVSG